MAKRERARRANQSDDEPKGATDTYIVRPGQTVQGADPDNEGGLITYAEGDEIELTEKEAKAIPWAVAKSGEKGARPGQTSRLKQRVKELEDEIARLRGDDAQRKKAGRGDDKGREEARQSLLARGDNFIGRGEPEAGKVPADALDAHDARVLREEMGGDDMESDDELAGGMHGVARETAGGASGGGPQTSNQSVPARVKPGESARPGSSGPDND